MLVFICYGYSVFAQLIMKGVEVLQTEVSRSVLQIKVHISKLLLLY
jgi:hypothetical protein